MNKKMSVLLLSLALSQMTAPAIAEPAASGPFNISCWKTNGTIYPSMAAPGENKVIYGPYSVKCTTIAHSIQLRSAAGARLPVTIEKLSGGTWSVVAKDAYDPYLHLGSGTFRVRLDNRGVQVPSRYKGTFSVPL